MKYLFYIFLFLTVIACDKKGIEVWDGEHYVYFTEKEDENGNSVPVDSINISFFFYIEDVISYPLEVALTGEPLDEDTPFKVVVDKEKSNLPEALYDFPEHFMFSKGQVKDTIYVDLKNDPILKEKEYSLKLDIVGEEMMLSHKGKNGSRLLKISDIAVRPEWWVEDPIEMYYLGKYSAKKYIYFMQVTNATKLDLENLSEARLLTLEFQHWLDNQNPKIMDEDNNPMKTEVIG